jgi:hypothetical protein
LRETGRTFSGWTSCRTCRFRSRIRLSKTCFRHTRTHSLYAFEAKFNVRKWRKWEYRLLTTVRVTTEELWKNDAVIWFNLVEDCAMIFADQLVPDVVTVTVRPWNPFQKDRLYVCLYEGKENDCMYFSQALIHLDCRLGNKKVHFQLERRWLCCSLDIVRIQKKQKSKVWTTMISHIRQNKN